MNDTVTIIVSVTKDRTAKSFGGPDYQPLKFSLGSEFLVSQQPVHDLQSLALVIGELEAEPIKAVICGLPLFSGNDPVARQPTNFYSTSHHWCMIDIDSLPWNDNLHDHKAMLEYASFRQSSNRLIAGITSPPEWALRLGSECICGIGWTGTVWANTDCQ